MLLISKLQASHLLLHLFYLLLLLLVVLHRVLVQVTNYVVHQVIRHILLGQFGWSVDGGGAAGARVAREPGVCGEWRLPPRVLLRLPRRLSAPVLELSSESN